MNRRSLDVISLDARYLRRVLKESGVRVPAKARVYVGIDDGKEETAYPIDDAKVVLRVSREEDERAVILPFRRARVA